MNVLEGFPIHVGHASLVKLVPLGERVRLVFTAQVSNITNAPHFTFPNNNLSNPNPGAFTAASVMDYNWPERLGARRMFLKIRVEW
jgi:hypothetical protein